MFLLFLFLGNLILLGFWVFREDAILSFRNAINAIFFVIDSNMTAFVSGRIKNIIIKWANRRTLRQVDSFRHWDFKFQTFLPQGNRGLHKIYSKQRDANERNLNVLGKTQVSRIF